MSSTLSGVGCGGLVVGYVPYLNGYSTYQDSLEGFYVFSMADNVVLHSYFLINNTNTA